MAQTPEITKLIADWQNGDRAAENLLFEALYGQIHAMAIACLRSEKGSSMSATDIVHEAYIKLRGSSNIDVKNRNHFMALTTVVMKHYIIDKARRYDAARHGGGLKRAEFMDSIIQRHEDATEVLGVSRALEQLRTEHARRARVAELRYFGGHNNDEIGGILGISTKQVVRDWNAARARLSDLIDGRD